MIANPDAPFVLLPFHCLIDHNHSPLSQYMSKRDAKTRVIIYSLTKQRLTMTVGPVNQSRHKIPAKISTKAHFLAEKFVIFPNFFEFGGKLSRLFDDKSGSCRCFHQKERRANPRGFPLQRFLDSFWKKLKLFTKNRI
jgi:hypothetical protein